MTQPLHVAVTGATGFLGKELVIRIAEEGHPLSKTETTRNVIITAIGRKEEIGRTLESQFPNSVKFAKIDLVNDKLELEKTLKNQDYVYHCAALCTAWGRYTDFYDANVVATQNVVDACKKADHLQRLIHISTPSIYTTGETRLNIKEDDYIPPSTHQINDYARTKLMAEGIISKAHKSGLPVICLRPRGIFGDDDKVILPKLVESLQKGRMVNVEPDPSKYSIITEITYVSNVVDAMLLASISDTSTLGKVYNITNGEQVHIYKLIRQIAKDVLGREIAVIDSEKTANTFELRRISFNKIYYIGYAMEWFYALMGWYDGNPTLTRYNACVIGLSMSFDIENAKRDLGYKPRVSIKEGITRTLQHWNKSNTLKSSL